MEPLILLFQLLVSPLREKAIRDEVLDPRVNWVLAKPEEFFSDLGRIGGYYRDFADCPRLWEAARFPSLNDCCTSIEHNCAYASYLRCRSRVSLHEDHTEAMSKTTEAYHAWDLLRSAQNPSWWIGERRRSLQKLRDVLGDADFYSGKMPDPVPLQFFQEVQ